MNALLTDLYELTMAAGYFDAGKTSQIATFELSIRRLPAHRNFVVVAGLPQVVDYLLNLKFTPEEIDYLRGLPQFRHVSAAFFDYLRDFRFTGDLFAVPEGTPLFAGEPLLTIRAPIVEGQIPETYLLSAVTFQTLIATKAARCVEMSGGRAVVEFGTRRAHTPEAGVLGARAAYLGGCTGTSNTQAGFRFGVPVMGTAAHSWVMSFACEMDAFRKLQKVLGESAVQLVDTYDTLEGARRVASLGGPLWGVRLDSGDFAALSRQVRAILDDAGLRDSKIMVSGDLDEYRIRDLVQSGAPIDAFGVGTQLATSGDAPSMGSVYKLVETETCGIKRFTAKYSNDKGSLPGSKQLFRDTMRDVVARSGECGSGEALMRPVILGGKLIEPLPTLEQARRRAAEYIAKLPEPLRQLEIAEPWPVIHSRELRELIGQAGSNLKR
ncbi:MAG TPA: nicotinate phosphoribosyltransferase [Candidatus Acidoferrales bacterium]|jgi:nicotinate phosphoribosyltransferase|nr:nicotinate phosphoribosyltransferase [Candidatus Acidoferrales bacterium]